MSLASESGMHLLDVNILIAMMQPSHAHHDRAQRWFHSEPGRAWATCPLTENAFLRVLGNPNYQDMSCDSAMLRLVLERACSFPGHQFWPDDLSLTDTATFPDLASSPHLTDIYLLALAVSRQGKLATLDARIDANLISGGTAAYSLIPRA